MNHFNIYNKIVEHRLSNIPENTYTEKHHIIPKCLNGTNNKDNLVTVTTKEHYVLHHLLTKIYPNNSGITRAFKIIRNRLNISRNSNPYSCIRKCEYSSKNSPMYGKTHSEETIQKMSLAHIGQISPNKGKTLIFSEEHKRKLSESHIGKIGPMYGKNHSKESKQKMSKSHYGKIIVNNGVIAKLVYPDNIPEGFVKGKLKKVDY